MAYVNKPQITETLLLLMMFLPNLDFLVRDTLQQHRYNIHPRMDTGKEKCKYQIVYKVKKKKITIIDCEIITIILMTIVLVVKPQCKPKPYCHH